jgi:mitogen-activated protein kinase 15
MTDVIDDRVLGRFNICQKVGQGAYGVVWKAIRRRKRKTTREGDEGGSGGGGDGNYNDNDIVALKKCFEAFRCDVDARRT